MLKLSDDNSCTLTSFANTSSNITNTNFNDNNNKMFVYDTEYNECVSVEVNNKMFSSFSGFSQFNFDNNLFICGSNDAESSTGAFLLKLEITNLGVLSNFLVNSIYPHYNPNICNFKSDYLVVIGGEKNKHCEYFNLRTLKWRSLPELPEERYKASVISEDTGDFIYLFGGYNEEKSSNCASVLKLHFKNNIAWDTVLIKTNFNCISRNSAAVFKLDKNYIYILGGKDNSNKDLDTIVEYDIQNKSLVQLENKKLKRNAHFTHQLGVDLNKNDFFFFDSENYVHKIAKMEFKINIVNFIDGLNGFDEDI